MNPSHFEDRRRGWRNRWIESIYEFSRPDLQVASWVRGCDWVSSYVECMCGYFNDLSLDSGYQDAIDRGMVSIDEARLLAAFHALADRYEEPHHYESDQAIISDPQWQVVVAAAQNAWVALQFEVRDPTEIELMASLDSRTWGPQP